MTILFISYRDVCYYRTSNCMLKMFLKDNESIYAGYCTKPMEGLFKLFVEGKKIKGRPSEIRVELSERETKVFRLIIKAGFEKKRKIWEDLLAGNTTKELMLEKLEEMLPVWVLKRKLSPEET